MEHKKLLYLDDELDVRLRKQAAKNHESVSAMIRIALRVGLTVLEGKPLDEIVAAYEPPTPITYTVADTYSVLKEETS